MSGPRARKRKPRPAGLDPFRDSVIDVRVVHGPSEIWITPQTDLARTWLARHCGAPTAQGRYVVEQRRAQGLLRGLYRAGCTMHVG